MCLRGSKFFDESILMKEEFPKYQILAWMAKKYTNTQLLYRATRDGFDSSAFHRLCDNKGPTVVIIKTKDDRIIGGYTTATWEGASHYKNADECFVFNLKPITKFPVDKERAIWVSPTYGPTFGYGHEIFVSNHSHSTVENYTLFNNVKAKFQATDIEIFLLS